MWLCTNLYNSVLYNEWRRVSSHLKLHASAQTEVPTSITSPLRTNKMSSWSQENETDSIFQLGLKNDLPIMSTSITRSIKTIHSMTVRECLDSRCNQEVLTEFDLLIILLIGGWFHRCTIHALTICVHNRFSATTPYQRSLVHLWRASDTYLKYDTCILFNIFIILLLFSSLAR